MNTSCDSSLGRTCEDIRRETCSIAQIIAQTPSAFSELRRQSEEQHLSSQRQADALAEGLRRLQGSVDGLSNDASSMSAVIRRTAKSMGLKMASLFEAVVIVRKLIVL
jgi:methyl-accepting chemotaxis protein